MFNFGLKMLIKNFSFLYLYISTSGIVEHLNKQLGLSFIWLQDQHRIGSIPICHCDLQGWSACRSWHELELTTSRVIMGHKGSELQGCLDSKIYLNPGLTYGFRPVLSDFFKILLDL